MNEKDKKRKGHIESKLLISPKEAKKLNLDTVKFWDDWRDYRDGMREWYKDRSRFHKTIYKYSYYDVNKNNKKLKRKEKIRKMRKIKKCLKD